MLIEFWLKKKIVAIEAAGKIWANTNFFFRFWDVLLGIYCVRFILKKLQLSVAMEQVTGMFPLDSYSYRITKFSAQL